MSLDTLKTKTQLSVHNKIYEYHSLPLAEKQLGSLSGLPFTLKILLENLLRHEDGVTVVQADFSAFVDWLKNKKSTHEIAYRPARVLMQDFTGVPAVADLAAMRDGLRELGGDPKKINPLSPVDLVIDHSVQVDSFGTADAFQKNTAIEMQRNHERYQFLRWGQDSFDNFQVVPPGTGICHQVNLEFLAKVVWQHMKEGSSIAYPDTLVGTDSHTTMINGLGVLGWGVGGIEAEAAMLGQPVSMLIPEVVGFKLTGQLPEGTTATDLVLTVTQRLRAHGVVGKFVEFYGPGLEQLALPDRATIANMAPEYGATCGFFPVDEITLGYLRLSGRSEETVALVEAYSKAQGLWHVADQHSCVFSSTLSLDLSTIKPSLAGPKRPQDRVLLEDVPQAFASALPSFVAADKADLSVTTSEGDELRQGAIVIAAITSCTNTSNPSVMLAAGILAKKAVEKGLQRRPWVKSSLAPGSKVVTEYFEKTGLQPYLDALGFDLVGYGCTTCIGNSGPLPTSVAEAVSKHDLAVCAVLSGNRNFEGRVHPLVKANWLASPPLVVAYALAGNIQVNLSSDPLGYNPQGQPVYLKDIWPSQAEIASALSTITHQMFREQYANVFQGSKEWNGIDYKKSETYDWDAHSTYVRQPPFFTNLKPRPAPLHDIKGAHLLAIFADSVTTDHISPAGSIKADSPAGKYLQEHGVEVKDFNAYGARRGNHEVMMRGTFANIRIRNEMVPGVEGGVTCYVPENTTMPIYDAAMKYAKTQTPLIIVAGKEYGTGSSRDWAAKGPMLLGVKAVIAESFERIHRSNLVGMGILPLQFKTGMDRKTLALTGKETFDILSINNHMRPGMEIPVVIHYADGTEKNIDVLCRIDTANEIDYFYHGGILLYVLRKLANESLT